MKRALAILAPLLVLLGGCLSAPVAQELVPVQGPPAPPPILMKEVVRLSEAGISDRTVIELIRAHGVLQRPGPEGLRRLKEQGVSEPVLRSLSAAPQVERPAKLRPILVYREFYIPLWPSYSAGKWRSGLRVAVYHEGEDEAREEFPEEPDDGRPLPLILEP